MPTGWSACSRKLNVDRTYLNTSRSIQIKKKNLTPWIPSKFHHVLMSLSSWIKFWRWKRLLKQINAKIPCSLCTWVGDVARCIQMFSHLHTPDILEEIWETNALSEQPMRINTKRKEIKPQTAQETYLKTMHQRLLSQMNSVGIEIEQHETINQCINQCQSNLTSLCCLIPNSMPCQAAQSSTCCLQQLHGIETSNVTAQPRAAWPTASKLRCWLRQWPTGFFIDFMVDLFKRAPGETTWNHAKHLEIPIAWVPSPLLAWPSQNVFGGLEFDLDPKSTSPTELKESERMCHAKVGKTNIQDNVSKKPLSKVWSSNQSNSKGHPSKVIEAFGLKNSCLVQVLNVPLA